MISVFWGLLGAVLIGTSDCIARVTAQRVSSTVLFLFIMGLSLIALSLWQVPRQGLPPWDTYAWTASAFSGVLNLVALFFLYKALARGPVTVASPAASTFAVLLVVLNAIAGEPWSPWQLLAVAIVFLGVSQLARHSSSAAEDRDYDSAWLRVTALYGLAAAAAVTLRMFLAQEAGASIGAINALWLNRFFAVLGVLVLLLWHFFRHVKLQWPKGRLLKLVLIQTFLETTALAAFLIGSTGDGRVGAAIGFSAFSAITAVVAWIWLGERIGLRRGIWMLVVGAGVALASATGAI